MFGALPIVPPMPGALPSRAVHKQMALCQLDGIFILFHQRVLGGVLHCPPWWPARPPRKSVLSSSLGAGSCSAADAEKGTCFRTWEPGGAGWKLSSTARWLMACVPSDLHFSHVQRAGVSAES